MSLCLSLSLITHALCLALFSLSLSLSLSLFRILLDAPVCSAEQKTLYGVATREPVQVPCDVNADPPQVSFHWTLNNSLKILPIKSFVSSHLRSVATYAPRSKFGYGQLHCWSSNSVGTQREPCVFNIIPAGPPQPVHNCIVGNQSTESFIVKCESGEDGGLEQSFHLEIYFSGGGFLHANLSSLAAPVFDVTSLPMSTSFVLVLYAANSKGRSNSVALSTSTLPFPTNKGKESLSPLSPFILILNSLGPFIAPFCQYFLPKQLTTYYSLHLIRILHPQLCLHFASLAALISQVPLRVTLSCVTAPLFLLLWQLSLPLLFSFSIHGSSFI